jgi:hypothetical protein
VFFLSPVASGLGARGPTVAEFYHLQGTRFVPAMPDQTCTEPSRSDGSLHSVAMPGFWIDVAWLWPGERFIPVRQALAGITAE